MARRPGRQTIGPDAWKANQQDYVFDALERGLKDVEFPASKKEIVNEARDEVILEEPDVRLGPYLETLPDKSYPNEDEVSRTLNNTWMDAYRDID